MVGRTVGVLFEKSGRLPGQLVGKSDHLQAVQDVLANTSKVMVDVEGGNNVMYLPLDKLTSNATSAVRRGAVPVELNSSTIRELTDAVTEQLRRDAAAQQSRRGGR